MTPTSNKAYQALLEKIQDLGQRQDDAFGDQIRCGAGCFACCHPPDSLFQVEAETLEQAVRELPTEMKARIQERLTEYKADPSLLCPLLEDGKCTVYHARPSICRTQGYALFFKDTTPSQDDAPSKGDLSWCELNFTEQQPGRDLAFDVERLNTMLSLVTQLGWPNQPARRFLVETLQQAIESASS